MFFIEVRLLGNLAELFGRASRCAESAEPSTVFESKTLAVNITFQYSARFNFDKLFTIHVSVNGAENNERAYFYPRVDSCLRTYNKGAVGADFSDEGAFNTDRRIETKSAFDDGSWAKRRADVCTKSSSRWTPISEDCDPEDGDGFAVVEDFTVSELGVAAG